MVVGSAVGVGRKTVTTAGTRVVLANATKVTGVLVTAETDNTGILVVGGSTVVAALSTREGTPLSPGDTVSIPTVDLDQVWIDSTVDGEGVSFTYVNDVRK